MGLGCGQTLSDASTTRPGRGMPSPAASAGAPTVLRAPTPTVAPSAPPPPSQPPARDPWADFGRADTDPENDFAVGPPETPEDCHERLVAADVSFKPAPLPLTKTRAGFSCGAQQAVVYLGSPSGVKYVPAPVVSCGMALALARFDASLQEHAVAVYGKRVRRVRHLGTYSCRNMARFKSWVSEHSYANAIDIQSIVLESWRTISVISYERAPGSEDTRFLHELAKDLVERDVFSVILTPAYDALHRDHFHLDLARYRVDGT